MEIILDDWTSLSNRLTNLGVGQNSFCPYIRISEPRGMESGSKEGNGSDRSDSWALSMELQQRLIQLPTDLPPLCLSSKENMRLEKGNISFMLVLVKHQIFPLLRIRFSCGNISEQRWGLFFLLMGNICPCIQKLQVFSHRKQ